MKFREFIRTLLEESSIHGFSYLVRRNLHWTEKLFWMLAILMATYFSIYTCLVQWKRFQDNPIIYTMDLTWGKSEFPFVGITICSNYTDDTIIESIIEDTWHVRLSKDQQKFHYYQNFLRTLSVLNIDNFHTLIPYENDQSLRALNLRQTLLKIYSNNLPKPPGNDENNIEATNKEQQSSPDLDFSGGVQQMEYAPALSEFGLCRTTSQLATYTNPYEMLKNIAVFPVHNCDAINECAKKIVTDFDGENLGSSAIYLHSPIDIAVFNISNHIMRPIPTKGALYIEIKLQLNTAEAGVRKLPIAYRKCRYRDENILKYFQVYAVGACHLECRVDNAYRKCGCKPFFYKIAMHLPICDIKGMLCLRKKRWPNEHKCSCHPMCTDSSYTALQTTYVKETVYANENAIIIDQNIPRLATKRSVVFSTDQLIVSFGGAIGLFLGASFISAYGIIYIFTKYLFSKCYPKKKSVLKFQFQKSNNT